MSRSATDISERNFRIGAAAILLLALGLRILGARGDLAQDEIMTLTLVGRIDRLDKVFWAINHDNNHVLNSAWQYLLGRDASTLARRSLSIVLGTGGVLAAGAWGVRRGKAGGLAAMLLFATSYLMVEYGSEARGYAGLVLFTLLAALTVEAALEGRDKRMALALCFLAGGLSHYYICFSFVALVVSYFWAGWRRTSSLIQAKDSTFRLFWPSGLLLVAIASPLFLHHVEIGSLMPFGLLGFAHAYNLSLQTSFNLPGLVFPHAELILAAAGSIGWFVYRRGDFRSAFYVSAIILIPLLITVCRIPNTTAPRYVILSDTAALLLLADVMATALSGKRPWRIAATVLLVAGLAGNGFFLAQFYLGQRGHYSEAVAAMTRDGPATYWIDVPSLTVMAGFYAAQAGSSLTYVPPDAWCSEPPRWVVLTQTSPGDSVSPTDVEGPASCRTSYALRQTYPFWGLTGAEWVLYERQ